MWSPSRRALITMPLALAACGFRPAFAPNGPAADLWGSIQVADTTTRNGFDFIQNFEEKLGRASAPRYLLTPLISASSTSLGITADGAVTRYNLLGSVSWTLTDITSGAELAKGVEQNFVGWSATGVTISAVNAETDANLRLMRILADQVATRLIALSPSLTRAP